MKSSFKHINKNNFKIRNNIQKVGELVFKQIMPYMEYMFTNIK